METSPIILPRGILPYVLLPLATLGAYGVAFLVVDSSNGISAAWPAAAVPVALLVIGAPAISVGLARLRGPFQAPSRTVSWSEAASFMLQLPLALIGSLFLGFVLFTLSTGGGTVVRAVAIGAAVVVAPAPIWLIALAGRLRRREVNPGNVRA
jgi:hypothetical protein